MREIFGYIEKKNLSEKTSKRTDMAIDSVSNIGNIEDSIEINSSKITTENMSNFDLRKAVVEEVIGDILSNGKFTVNINLGGVSVEKNQIERFILELLPRLREIGGKVVITNNNILDNSFLKDNKLV